MRLLSSIRRAPAHPELAQRAGFVAAAEESEVGVDLGRASHAGPTSGVVDVPVATSEVESYWYAALRHGALLSSSTAGPATPGACGTRPGDLCPDGVALGVEGRDGQRRRGSGWPDLLDLALDLGSIPRRASPTRGTTWDRCTRPAKPAASDRSSASADRQGRTGEHLPPSCEHGTWTFAGSDEKPGAAK